MIDINVDINVAILIIVLFSFLIILWQLNTFQSGNRTSNPTNWRNTFSQYHPTTTIVSAQAQCLVSRVGVVSLHARDAVKWRNLLYWFR